MLKESKSKQRVAKHMQTCPVRGIMDEISKKWTFLLDPNPSDFSNALEAISCFIVKWLTMQKRR